MTEAARVSVVTEVVGLDKAQGQLSKFEAAAKKAGVGATAAMAALEKQISTANAALDRAFGQIAGSLNKLDSTGGKGFSGVGAALSTIAQGAQVAEKAISQSTGRMGADIERLNAQVEKMAASINSALTSLGPSASAAAASLEAGTRAMATFDSASQSMLRSSAALEDAINTIADAQKRLADTLKAPQGGGNNPFKPTADSLEELRAKFNPLYEIGLRYKQQVDDIKAAHTAGAISATEMAIAIERAGNVATVSQTAYVKMDDSLRIAGGHAKLTANQIQNLGYQANDVATMLLMGASPFQIIASQAGQVVQALQDGPGGIMGSLKAMGGYIARAAAAIGPFGFGMAAVATGATALAFAMKKDIEPAKDIIDRQRSSVEQLRKAYGFTASAAEDYGRRAKEALTFTATEGYDKDVKNLQDRVTAIGNSLFGGSDNKRRLTLPEFEPLRKAFMDLQESAKRGVPDFIAFENALARIAASSPKGNAWWGAANLNDAAREAQGLASGLGELQLAMEDTRQAIDKTTLASERMKTAFTGAMGILREFSPAGKTAAEQIEEAFLNASAAAQGMGDAMNAVNARNSALAEIARPAQEAARAAQQELANFDLSPVQRQIADVRAEYERRIEAAKRTSNVEGELNGLAAEREAKIALIAKEASRAEEARRAGAALDLQSVNDRTAAQIANTAAERARIQALGAGEIAAEASARAEEARTLSLSQARAELNRAYENMSRSQAAQTDRAQFELSLIGKSAGEVARLRAEYEMLAQAKDIAHSAGMDESTVSLTEAMREQARAIGEVTEATLKLNLALEQQDAIRRAQLEGSLAFADPSSRAVAMAGLEAEIELRNRGIDVNSEWGRTYVENEKRLESFRVKVDEQVESFNELRDAAKEAFLEFDTGKSFIENLTSAFAKLGASLASKGFDKLFGGVMGALTGQPQQGSSTGGGLIGAIGGAAGIISSGGNTPVVGTGVRIPVPTSSPGYQTAQSAATSVAAISGSMMTYASRFNQGVDARLMKILETTATQFPYKVEAISGVRPGDSRFHGRGLAADINIYGSNGKAFGNYQNEAGFRIYEQFAQKAREVQQKLFPELDKAFRWGGYFSGPRGKYGALDSMHFDVGGNRVGMGGGTWEGGLTAQQRRYFPGAQSIGMGGASDSGVRASDQRLIARGVEQGVVDASRKTGNIPIPTGRPESEVQGPAAMQMTGGQRAVGAIGAGIGIFSNGYQSGSPLQGGVSGALGGYQAAGALGFTSIGAGIAGGVIGAGIGILGGILGARKQRAEAHKQAAAEWDKIKPQYEAFDKSLSGENTGQIREWLTSTWSQLSAFMSVGGKAWKNGTGNSTAQFQSTGTKMFDRFEEMLVEFREGFDSAIADLASGTGPNGSFAKGRAAVKELNKQIDAFLDDTAIAFGSDDIGIPVAGFYTEASKQWEEARNAAIEKAKKASGEWALSLLYTEDTMSDVQKSIEGFRGSAAALPKILEELGWTAQEAADAVAERLNKALKDIATNLETGVTDRIFSLDGKDYVPQIRAFLEDFKRLTNEFKDAGADASKLAPLFQKEINAILSNADETTLDLDELVKIFPQLSDAVNTFKKDVKNDVGNEMLQRAQEIAMQAAVDARSRAEAVLREEYQRTVNFIEGLKEQLSNMKLNDEYSTLDPKAQFEAAQKAFRDTLARAQSGDKDAQEKLVGVTQEYLDEAKAYYATTERYGEVYNEIESALREQITKAESELDVAKRQATFLAEIAGNTKGLTAALTEYLEAMKKQTELQKQIDGNRTFGANPERNRLIDAGLRQIGLTYTGNYGFQADGSDPFRSWRESLPAAQLAAVIAVINQHIGINRASGGPIWGVGTGTSDSIRANLSNGEFVVREAAARNIGYDNLGAMNRTGLMPVVPTPVIPNVTSVPNSNELADQLRVVTKELRMLREENRKGQEFMREGIDRGTQATRDVAAPLQRVVSRL